MISVKCIVQISQKTKIKFCCKGIQKDGNNINYQKNSQKNHNVLFNKHKDEVLNQGFCYVDGYMKSYEQNKKGLSFVYYKRIVYEDGITTKHLIFKSKLHYDNEL
jgi:hypothetical protein